MADDEYDFLRDSGLGRLIAAAGDPESYSAYKDIGTSIYDLGAVPINKATEFATGYNPGFSGSKFFGRKDDEGNLIDQDVAYFGVPTDATQGFTSRDERTAPERRKRERSDSRLKQNRLGSAYSKKEKGSIEEMSPSELINMMRTKNDPRDDARESYGKAKINRNENYDIKKRKEKKAELEKLAAEAEAAAKIAPRDTVLGRIFDRRVMPGNELSNNEKAFAYIRNISDNLLERREVGGKEGTSTLSRILGPGGGIGEGSDEIKALQKNAIALREKGENKKAAEQDKAILQQIQKLDYQKTQAEIGRIDSETTKNIADAISGGDKPKAIKLAEYQARIRGFNVEKDPQAYYAEVDKIMSVGISQGQSSVYETIQGMELRLSGMNDDDPGKQQLEEDIAGLRARSTGTTVDNYVPKDDVYRDDGTPRT